MISIVSICNRALSKIGDDISILSLDDDIKQARYCKALYEDTLNFVLRSYAWKFAIKRYSIARNLDTPAFGNENVFDVPVDCLRVLSERENREFKLEGNKVYFEDDIFDFWGIARITDVTRFDSCFVEVLSLYLAIDLCVPLTGDYQKKNQLEQELDKRLAIAKKCNAFETFPMTYNVIGALESRV